MFRYSVYELRQYERAAQGRGLFWTSEASNDHTKRPQATTTLFTTRPCNVLITYLVFIVFRAPGNIV